MDLEGFQPNWETYPKSSICNIYYIYIYISLYIQYYMYKCICIRNCIYIYVYVYEYAYALRPLGLSRGPQSLGLAEARGSHRGGGQSRRAAAHTMTAGRVDLMGRWWEFHGNFMGISWEYDRNMIEIWGIWWEYHIRRVGNMMGVSWDKNSKNIFVRYRESSIRSGYIKKDPNPATEAWNDD